jgi:hypothetical protein
MTEWVSVFAVFWILWAVDGVRLVRRRIFTVIARGGADRRWRSRVAYDRLSLPGFGPASMRLVAQDVPLTFSPAGVTNRLTGAAGRPAERPGAERTWRWDEIRAVGLARGWIFINGARFCPNTGHVRADELLALAQLPAAARAVRLQQIVRRWFRPVQLRRRLRLLQGRTRVVAALNALLLVGLAALTIYVVADVAARIPEAWGRRAVAGLPTVAVALLVAHGAALVLAARALRRLKAVAGEQRGSALFSAALLPAQALRLRSLLGEGWFPAQHPAALLAAVGSPTDRAAGFFQVLADLRWPLDRPEQTATREMTEWFGRELETQLQRLLAADGLTVEGLLAPPAPDGRGSCSYCPRCRDQFVRAEGRCPQGVPLRPLRRGGGV